MAEQTHAVKPHTAKNTPAHWPTPTRHAPGLDASPVARSAMASGGQSLDKHTQATMSARFGHDFSSVRVHTDARAGVSAEAMGANAYALGSDIVFGEGKYTPGSPETERILAHELTHVVQQARGGTGDWGRLSQRGDASEREAESLASQVMMGRSVDVQAAPQAAVARIPDNNAWDDWGDASGGLSFDHFGPPSSWFIKPPLSDGAPSDFAPQNGRPPLSGGTLTPQDADPKIGPTVPLPPPGPRVPQPDPPLEFTPKPAPDPPVTVLPPYQYTPKVSPGLQPSVPIAPFPAPPDMTTPLPPVSPFPPTPSPVGPMVPPLHLDPITPPAAPGPSAPVPAPDPAPLPDDQQYA